MNKNSLALNKTIRIYEKIKPEKQNKALWTPERIFEAMQVNYA